MTVIPIKLAHAIVVHWITKTIINLFSQTAISTIIVAGFEVIFWVAEAITNLANIWTAVTPIIVAFFIEID